MATAAYVGGKIDEQGYATPWYQSFKEGVGGANSLTALKVVQRAAGANMSVDVSLGVVFIATPESTATHGYWGEVTSAASNVVVDAADVSNPRIDRVVAYIDLATISTAVTNNVGALKFDVVPGTPASSPSAPVDATVQTAVGASNPWIELARISVSTGAASISDANITDKRVSAGLRLPVIKTVTALSADTILSHAYDFVTMSASGGARQITLPDPSLQTGRTMTFIRTDSTIANTCRITRFTGTTISGVTDVYFPNQRDSLELYSDGTNWEIRAEKFKRELVKVNVTSPQTGITAAADLTGLTTVGSTVGGIIPTSASRIRVRFVCSAVSDSNSTCAASLDIKDVTNANAIIQSAYVGTLRSDTSNQHINIDETYAPGTAGGRTWKATASRTVGSGSVAFNPAATAPMFMQIELMSIV